jgi:hypothetical protein
MMMYTNNLYRLTLYDWREVLDILQRQRNWLNLFTVALALYSKEIKELS